MNTSAESKFRSLSKRAAECQRQIGRLSTVDSVRSREETAAQIRSDLRQLEQDIKVCHSWQAFMTAQAYIFKGVPISLSFSLSISLLSKKTKNPQEKYS